MLACDLTQRLGERVSEQAIGGIITSLTAGGLIGLHVSSRRGIARGNHSGIWLTESGFAAWAQESRLARQNGEPNETEGLAMRADAAFDEKYEPRD